MFSGGGEGKIMMKGVGEKNVSRPNSYASEAVSKQPEIILL